MMIEKYEELQFSLLEYTSLYNQALILPRSNTLDLGSIKTLRSIVKMTL